MGFINGKSVVNRIMLPPQQSTPINLPEQGDWKSDEKLHCVTAVIMSEGAITLTCIFYKLYMLNIMYKYMYVCLYLLKNKCKFLAFIHSFYPRTCSLCSYNSSQYEFCNKMELKGFQIYCHWDERHK